MTDKNKNNILGIVSLTDTYDAYDVNDLIIVLRHRAQYCYYAVMPDGKTMLICLNEDEEEQLDR